MNILTGLGLSLSSGYDPAMVLLMVCVYSKLGMINLAENRSLMGSYIFMFFIILVIILKTFINLNPITNKLAEIFSIPLTLICGYLIFTSIAGNSSIANNHLLKLLFSLLGIGASGVSKTSSFLNNSISDMATLGATAPINSFKDTIKSIFLSIVSILAPFLILIFSIFLIMGILKIINKIKQLKINKNLEK